MTCEQFTLSSFFMFLSAIYNILFSFTLFKDYDTVRDKILFSRYKKNHSYLRNVLTMSYILFISDLILSYSRFDFFQVKLHRFHDLYNAELNDNFMRQSLASINLSICITLWYATRNGKLSSQKQDSHWKVTLCLD